jgi:hypothetical protein
MAECSVNGGKEVNLLVFSEEDIPDILEPLGYTIKEEKIYHGDQIKTCDCCGKELGIDQLGNVLPGSALLYCKDISCFAEYMRTRMGL